MYQVTSEVKTTKNIFYSFLSCNYQFVWGVHVGLMLAIPNIIYAQEIGTSEKTEFFTWESFTTLSGTSFFTVIICNSLQHAFHFNPRWLALIVAEILCIAIAFFNNAGAAREYFLAIANGFLVYSSAAGSAQIIGRDNAISSTSTTSSNLPPPSGGTRTRRFWSKWF